MNSINPKVDFYFSKAQKWQKEMEKLRMIILDCPLSEELKWGVPCYTYSPETVSKVAGSRPAQKSNIVLIHAFKEYCAMLFFKGALLNDTHGILVQQTKNVQSARQIRFSSAIGGIKEIVKMEPILKAYIYEAIELEKAGVKVALKKTEEFPMPEEFQKKLDVLPELKNAFEALTPGRQRGYLLYFSSPKQSKTRESRVESYTQQILEGKGLND
ncbi:MAG: YdeI/OmpD-associated family protein [Ferruginibacter sp.]